MHIFILVTNDDLSLDIFRARSHADQTGSLTPLVVSLSSIDKSEKVKGVDLICIVDVSGSMYGSKIQLVRESLKYLVNLMNEQDNIALITFTSYTDIICDFTKMTSYNKSSLLDDINNLRAYGGTNIYSALRTGLEFVRHDYSSGDRIASMILLSDGEDNYYSSDRLSSLFKQLLINTGKSNYVFTLHTLGFGSDHDYELMNKLSLIKDGGYFAIQRLLDVQDAYLKIYGSLSTICSVNVNLTIQSNFKIEKVYGMEDMYEASLKNDTKISTFQTTLIQVIYGKNYYFVVLVNIPENTPFGTEVLNATISPLGISKKYLWDETYSNIAYEEYIRCISFTYFSDAYILGNYLGVEKIKEGRAWIEVNYNGVRDWIGEFDDVLYDMNNNYYYGANLLSKLRELKTSQIGIHYNNNENTYINNILYSSHNIDISNLPFIRIVGQTIIKFDININYYYFYLKEGFGEINNLPFSGYGSSLIIYSDDSSGTINITSLSDYIEYYYWNETKTRIQNIIDFSKGGKFIFEKDFPYEFYSRVDGTKDITFNIEFLKLEINGISNTVEHLFEIIAYIVDDREIQNLENNKDYSLPSTIVYEGYYDSKLSLGNIVIKKEEISRYLSSTTHSYLYIIIKKVTLNINIYKHVEGQFIFVSMDNIYSVIPAGFSIFSYLPRGQKSPHLYTLEGKNITIEFSSLGNDLDCKILKYQNYPTGSEELYIDYNKFIIKRREDINKTYINVVQDNNENTTTDNLIISIFSKNNSNSNNSSSNLSYIIKYTSHSFRAITPQRPTARVILLGFARFVYIRTIRICYFSIYFARIREIVYSETLIVTIKVTYKNTLRRLQEDSKKQVECKLEDCNIENQNKYNCSFETNGEEIDNIEIEDDFDFKDQNIDVISKTPIANQYISNLTNLGEKDNFNKKLYILDNSTRYINNDNNEFNITGTMNDKSFNYENLVLTLNSEDSNEKTINYTCKAIKLTGENYTIQCNSNSVIKANFDGAFSDLGNENLIINFMDNPNGTIDFTTDADDDIEDGGDEDPINLKIINKKGPKLTAGGIVGIVVSCVAVLALTTALIICLRKKPNIGEKNNNNSVNSSNIQSTFRNL